MSAFDFSKKLCFQCLKSLWCFGHFFKAGLTYEPDTCPFLNNGSSTILVICLDSLPSGHQPGVWGASLKPSLTMTSAQTSPTAALFWRRCFSTYGTHFREMLGVVRLQGQHEQTHLGNSKLNKMLGVSLISYCKSPIGLQSISSNVFSRAPSSLLPTASEGTSIL